MDLSDKSLRVNRGAKYVHKPGYKFPVEKRIEVVTKWLALGNMRLVSELTGVSYQLCRLWKMEEWWDQLVEEVKVSRSKQLDTKLSKIVDKSLDTIADRLEYGDVVFNQKTGEVVRKEVSLKDATKVATDLLTRQAVIQKLEDDKVVHKEEKSIKDQLTMLALEFAKFNKTNTGPVEDALVIGEDHSIYDQRQERLQEGGGEVYQPSGSSQEENGTECSSSGDDKSWPSEEGGWEGRGPYQATEQGWDDLQEELEGDPSKSES